MTHWMNRVAAILSFGVWLASNPLEAAEPESSQGAERCAVISHDVERLACYDRFFQRGVASTEAADAAANAAASALAEQTSASDATVPDNAPAATSDTPSRTRGRFRQWLDALSGETDRRQREGDSSELVPLDANIAALANAGRGSLLDRRWELAKDSKFGVFNLRAYKPIYALPVFWSSHTNPLPHSPNPSNSVREWQNLQPIEGKFQLSFKTKILENLFGDNGDLWGAYTQTSRWQMYNGEESRPFRETNYEPEVMLTFRNRYRIGGWNGRLAGIGINHQSNGKSDPQSRSWNRIVAMIGLDRENWALVIRPWWRLPEGTREDNNPDIEDYMGRGEAMLVWHQGEHEVSSIVRHSLRGGDRSKGALQMDWGFPLDGPLRGHVQVFSGYGESLIDYNHKATYVGFGISLTEWF
jgi:phospholipase A1